MRKKVNTRHGGRRDACYFSCLLYRLSERCLAFPGNQADLMEKQFSVFSVYYVIDALFNFKKSATVEFCQLSTQMCGSMVKNPRMDWWNGTSSREQWMESKKPKPEGTIMRNNLRIGGGGQPPSIGGGGQPPAIGGGGQPD